LAIHYLYTEYLNKDFLTLYKIYLPIKKIPYRLFVCTVNLIVLLHAQLELGSSIKHSSINKSSKTLMHINDNLGNGFYSWLKMDFGSMVYVNQMCMSTDQENMVRGSKKKVFGIYGFSNLGYIQFKKEDKHLKHLVTVGRNYIDHGFGKYSKLLISKWSRPFDQIRWQAQYKGITANMIGIQLDQIGDINRYLSIHTIDFTISENLTLSFGESAIYSGKNRGIELQYFNPTLFWVPIRENQMDNQANSFLYNGIKYSKNKFSMWYEFLLDDYQIDREIKEPTTYGLTFGLEKDNNENFISNYWFEYTMVSNRTYQTQSFNNQEDYLHRGFPIGHQGGNDFNQIIFSLSSKSKKFFSKNINYNLKVTNLRDGANGLDTPWDTPWLDENGNNIQNFSENSPTEPINSILEGELYATLHNKKSYLDVGLFFQNKSLNTENSSNWTIYFRYEIYLGKKIKY